MHVIETANCFLNDVNSGDEGQLLRLYTDSEMRTHLGGAVELAAARERVKSLLDGSGPDKSWAIRRKLDNCLMGLVTLGPHHDGEDTEVSYAIFPEYRGKGYGTEATRAIVAFGLDTLCLRRVIVETQATNLASRRLLERIGMLFSRTVIRFGAEQAIYVIEKS